LSNPRVAIFTKNKKRPRQAGDNYFRGKKAPAAS